MCGIQLFVHRRSASRSDDGLDGPIAAVTPWHQSTLGRMLICLLLTQGLAFCLQQLFTAWILASGTDSAESWNTPLGLVGLHLFHLVGLLAGGMLLAANQDRGISASAMLGLWNGLVFITVHRATSDSIPPWLFFSQPLLHLFFGILGGWLGYRIWPPVTVVAPDEPFLGERVKQPAAPPRPWLRGKIHTIRVMLGAAVVVLGVLLSRHVMNEILLQFPNFRMHTYLEENLFRYQIAAFAVFLGSAFAGATTSNGFKQGLCVGLVAGSLFIGTQFANPKATLEPTLFTAFGVFAVSLVGGAFGGALFPPVAARTKKAIPY
jgi:hypothetical protein